MPSCDLPRSWPLLGSLLFQPGRSIFLNDFGTLGHFRRQRKSGVSDHTGFQWAHDFRDPNSAWTGGQKAVFLLVYTAFWAFVVVLVHFWPALVHLLVERSARTRTPAGATEEVSSSAPALDLGAEVNVGPCAAYPSDKRVIELFEEQVLRVPQSTALVVPGTGGQLLEVSYAKLQAAAEEFCEVLLSMGISCRAVVALVMDRSAAQVVAVYGVLKAGAAFLPVDADAPPARKRLLVVESEALAVVGPAGHGAKQQLASDAGLPYISLPEDSLGGCLVHQPHALLGGSHSSGKSISMAADDRQRPGADDMALLIYTSGTTGAPKGIVYNHRHLLHGVYFFGQHCQMHASSVALLKSPLFWAVFEWEMFPALTLGGKLVVAAAAGHRSPEYLVNSIRSHEVSVLMITPQVLDLVLDIHVSQATGQPLHSLKHIVTVGEPLACSLANRLVRTRGLNAELHNFYGASESSCTIYTVPKEGIDLSLFPSKAPAGLPQPHAAVYVMTAEQADVGVPVRLTPVRTGEAGEICFGGVLAAGYWKREELMLEKWIETERYGRLYRTGDQGRWRCGVLEVIGRMDRQVKIRGVRVEPEEVEAVLKRFSSPMPDHPVPSGSNFEVEMALRRSFSPPSHSSAPNGVNLNAEESLQVASASVQCAGLKEVAVVASQEPAELVAFVSKREGGGDVSVEALRAHCRANLAAANVPKFFVVLQELPKLPCGKADLPQLRHQASQHVNEQGEVVMDSLGQMKKLSKQVVFENAVIHRCYSYWMLGVLTDHYSRCASDKRGSDLYAFCTPLARESVKPWTELLIRALGNDQCMFGFIMLGAYQDSRPERPGAPPRVGLGSKDLFVFAVYLCMALPFPQLLHLTFRSWAWRQDWGGEAAPKDVLGWDYMKLNSWPSGHRWYLEMVLEARVFLQICERLQLPGWAQGILATAPCFLPSTVLGGHTYAFDFCADATTPVHVLYIFSWLFGNSGTSWGGCAIYWVWMQWYLAFYVWCFHYSRPLVVRAERFLPWGRTWAAASIACSMMIGVLMAMFHYPNQALETGVGTLWAALEVGANVLQPLLLVLGMTHLPLNLQWWGSTTLSSYVFHYYFRDQVTTLIVAIGGSFVWDLTGLVLFLVIVGFCLCVTSFLGPLGHCFLFSLSLVRKRGAAVARTCQAASARGRAA